MLKIKAIKSSVFDANCYVMWVGDGKALVVDPGPGTAEQVDQVLAEENLNLGAVLLTHGHFDHVWEAQAVAKGEVPVYITEPDLDWLDDPAANLDIRIEALGLTDWQAIQSVRPIRDLELAPVDGINLRVVPAPGHSPGSAVFLLGAQGMEQPAALSGDVVFAGSVGRTDLPGGDEFEMRESLRTLATSLDPSTVLLPGHGPTTVWREQLDTNPYVKRAVARR